MSVIRRLRKRVGGYMERKREENRKIAEIRRSERFKQRIKTAEHIERISGERRRKYYATGGFGGEMCRGFGGVAQAFRSGPVMATSRLVSRRKRKKKSRKRKRK